MKLRLEVSKKMTAEKEDLIIRISANSRKELDIPVGSRLVVRGDNNISQAVEAKSVHIEDLKRKGECSYISQETFDLIKGIEEEEYKPITLGCDPEFVFVDSNRSVYPANLWLPHAGKIGSDGPLGEIRPDPAEHEEELVDNLRHLIRRLPSLAKEKQRGRKKLVAEAHSCWENYALGFHIHFGIPKELLTYAAPGSEEFIRSFVTILDYFVGIPAMLLEDTNIRRLGNGRFGKPGDYRLSPKTLEYRTPGGFHLRHPDYARGILGLALCIGKDVLIRVGQASNNWRELYKYSNFFEARQTYNLPSRGDIHAALLSQDKQLAVSHLSNIIKQLPKLQGYGLHSKSISSFLLLTLQNKQHSPLLADNW